MVNFSWVELDYAHKMLNNWVEYRHSRIEEDNFNSIYRNILCPDCEMNIIRQNQIGNRLITVMEMPTSTNFKCKNDYVNLKFTEYLTENKNPVSTPNQCRLCNLLDWRKGDVE